MMQMNNVDATGPNPLNIIDEWSFLMDLMESPLVTQITACTVILTVSGNEKLK